MALRWDDRAPGVFHALEMWGFDPSAKSFLNLIFDNGGGVRRFSSPGWQGDTLTWTRDPVPTSAPDNERYILQREPAERQFVFTWEIQRPGGPWTPGDHPTCVP